MIGFKIISLLLLGTLCMTSHATQSEVEQMIKAGNKFSMNLFSDYATSHSDSNLMMSPFSAWITMSMAAYGSKGQTFEELKKSLLLPQNSEVAFNGFKQILEDLEKINNVDLKIKNKLYVSQGFSLNNQYADTIKKVFHCENSEFSYSNPEKAANDINNWVSEATNNKIQNLVNQNEITEDLRMMILNAVYFKGDWEVAFDTAETVSRNFYYNENRKMPVSGKLVPTMTALNSFFHGYSEDLNARFIELPYKNKDAKMTVIIPNKDTNLGEVLTKLKDFDASRLQNFGYKSKVQLLLPKFKINSEVDLEESFKHLGVQDTFSSRANFGAMSNENLVLSKIKQKTFTEVNEQGSESAAATAARAVTYSAIEVFDVNKPSLFFITVKDVIVMMGYLGDPQY